MDLHQADVGRRRQVSASVRQAPTSRGHRRLFDIGSLVVLAILTTAIWARPVLGDFGSRRLSGPGDPNSFEFYLGWNVHALLTGQNPFFTSAWYAPAGLDLGNAISVPAVSILVAPVTLVFGTTAAYNVAILLSVVLAAAAVYLLARELFGSIVGAFLAGSLVVVSPYLIGHGVGHLNMMWVWGLPFVVFLAARHFHGRLRTTWLVLWTALTVAFSIGSSTELFVTQSGFAVVAAVIALVVVDDRQRFMRTLARSAFGGAAGVVLGLPAIIASIRAGVPDTVFNPPSMYPTDLTNLFFPTELVEVGDSWGANLRTTWLANGAENTAYIPPTMLVLVILALAVHRDRATRAILIFAALALFLSFGPYLTVAGKQTVPLPWRFTEHVPGLDHALTVRFSAFVFFAVALLVAALWARRAIPRWATAVLAVGSLVLLVPSTGRINSFTSDTEPPDYIADGTWKKDIQEGDNVLVLPSGQSGDGMLWQTRTDFAFSMPTGNGGGALPPADTKRPVGQQLFQNVTEGFDWEGQLPPYLEQRDVTTILVEDTADGAEWKRVIDDVYPGQGRLSGGVWVYDVS